MRQNYLYQTTKTWLQIWNCQRFVGNVTGGIPYYEAKIGEAIEVKRARLLYQSRKRGMLENGLLLSSFAAQHLSSMNYKQLEEYDRLINLPSNDWDIYYWAIGNKPVPESFDGELMTTLKKFAKNENQSIRSVQPELHSKN